MYYGYNNNATVNVVCLQSSTLFLLNAAICWIYGFRVYSVLFVILTITSWLFHSNPESMIYNVIDKIAIAAVVSYGAYMLHTNWNKYTFYSRMAIIATFLSTLFLFTVGYMFNVFCYDPMWGNIWHAILHVISVIGHAMMVVMI